MTGETTMVIEIQFIEGYDRGHLVRWECGVGCYVDTGEPIDNKRPCPQCGKPPTPEGYDACLGHIAGATSACCGHGVTRGYIVWESDIQAETSVNIIDEIQDRLDLLSELLAGNND